MEDLFEEEQRREDGISFDLKQYLSKLLRNYPWIILTTVMSLFGAYLFLRYSTPKYQVSGSILVGGGALESGANSILANAGMINGTSEKESVVSNEIFILQSHQINGAVVDSLKLDVLIAKTGNLKDEPMLLDSLPFVISVGKLDPDRSSPVYNLVLENERFVLGTDTKNYIGLYGKPIILDGDTIVLKKKAVALNIKGTLSLQFVSRIGTIQKYLSRLTVEQAQNGGTGLLKLSLIDELPARAYEYIQVLIHAYNRSYTNYKNQATRSALVFLGERLKTVSTELDQQESDVRDFKSTNQLYDISSTATQLLTNLQTLDNQKGQNNYQDQLLSLVESTIKKSGKEEIVASTSGLQDPILAVQVSKYNDLVFAKQMILSSGTDSDPRLAPLNTQLVDVRSSILSNIENIRKQFRTGRNYVSAEESKYSSRFQVLPEKEKRFVELTRKLAIKESQYIFLLQKKEETEIQLVSSDGGMSRTVDDVLNDGKVYPIALNVYAIAFAGGLILPGLIILLQVFFNQRLESRGDIESNTDVPILGELGLSNSEKPIVISTTNRTAFAEQLRAIRANLAFIGDTQKVFIITSTMSGEGKSFLSLNLGNSIAINNKKVAVLELDLRKPMLSKKLGLNNRVGISNYIINPAIKEEDIIQELADYPNLYVVNSGPIPPNPGELILHQRMERLIEYLREHFDYVILDLPPIGLVADAQAFSRLADLSLFVVRPNYSLRSSLKLINDLNRQKKLPHLSIVVNGVEANKGYGGYGYGYGGYGYGYYSEDEESKSSKTSQSLKNFIKRFKQ
jgi:capsular exopolysaccharide synthesis family protein